MKKFVLAVMLGAALAVNAGSVAVQAKTAGGRTDAHLMKQTSDRLKNTEWVLEDLGGNRVLDSVQPTIRFDDAGRTTGTGGCNRFNGPYVLDGDQLTIGPLASTRRACESDISLQESRFLQAIELTERVEVNAPFLFLYTTQYDRPLRFVPLTSNSEAITTIVAFQGRENAVRIFVQGGRTRMNVFNKADQVTWMRGVPVSVESTPDGLRYINQSGETAVSVYVPTSGEPTLSINGEPDR